MVKRVYVEKRPPYNNEARQLAAELRSQLNILSLESIRIINRYDIERLAAHYLEPVIKTVLSEPNLDIVYRHSLELPAGTRSFAVAYLVGQFDQRADSAEACIEILTDGERPIVRHAKVYILQGELTAAQFNSIKQFLINPIDSREVSEALPLTLDSEMPPPAQVEVLTGFIDLNQTALTELHRQAGFAMTLQDLRYIRDYFSKEKRDPTMTEMRAIDTYWSDHCRHTTFNTTLTDIVFEECAQLKPISQSFQLYCKMRQALYGQSDRPINLMDMATIAAKYARHNGQLDDLDISEEVNACSVNVPAKIDGQWQDWLVMFKNETHNHPTEIEPFGGAATCLGGAIRDPLSGRAYVYQAMRLTGCADPRRPLSDTLPGKLPQRKITTEAARGYSSYGNQIGIATGQVSEVYHDNFAAKRMEIGCVIAACPKSHVVRQTPRPGDVIVLLGGRTGLDGIGGATGSSKIHDEHSVKLSGAQVQKGNAPTERKIQRLFRNPQATRLIKRCNDFGAGGVAVAIGEIADAIDINLDLIPKKYAGLDGTSLAISESQERMALLIAPENCTRFMELAAAENLEATVVAQVTDSGRLRMYWQNEIIFDVARDFLDSHGAAQQATVKLTSFDQSKHIFKPAFQAEGSIVEQLFTALRALPCTSQKGLIEMFDSTVGAATVLMPLGGIHQLTAVDGMVAKLPHINGESSTCTCTTYGYDPAIAMWHPYYGAYYAVVSAVAKQIALGTALDTVRLSLQEYFEKLGDDPEKWAKPFSALLAALTVQDGLAVPAIGGKDSMSGNFGEMAVPPTLVAFAVGHNDVSAVISPEIKREDSILAMYIPPYQKDYTIDLATLKADYQALTKVIREGKVRAIKAIGQGGALLAICQMAVGNGIAFTIDVGAIDSLTTPYIGGFVLELATAVDLGVSYLPIGLTNATGLINIGNEQTTMSQIIDAYQMGLQDVFPSKSKVTGQLKNVNYVSKSTFKSSLTIARPRVYIPVFPGTNSEYDLQYAFQRAGADVHVDVFKNLSANDIAASIGRMAQSIEKSQIIALPGGFSGGDEPDGSAKLIATIFRNPCIADAVRAHLSVRDGLILGICNGFQALIKLGLIPYGDIRPLSRTAPTLTHNVSGKHISRIVDIRVASNHSPWLADQKVGTVYSVPVSHGEGRFICDQATLQQMISNGQIATQYVNFGGEASLDYRFNPNGSTYAIEGAFSPDGRVFGKMGHSERYVDGLYQNIAGHFAMPIFQNAMRYYK